MKRNTTDWFYFNFRFENIVKKSITEYTLYLFYLMSDRSNKETFMSE